MTTLLNTEDIDLMLLVFTLRTDAGEPAVFEGYLFRDRTGRRTNIVEVMDAVTRRCHEDVAVLHLPRAHTQESASGD